MTMNMLEKIRALSRGARKKFSDLPDMKADGMLKDLNAGEFADTVVEKLKSDAKEAGFGDLQVKVVAVGLRIIILDPTDKNGNKIATTEVVQSHPDLNLADLFSSADDLGEMDAEKMKKARIRHNEEQNYEAGKYDGMMYG